MDWNDGYVADIAYPAAFFPEQSPTHLSIACILNGVEPVPLDRPFTYFELGAGMGLTASVLAASHPHGRFYANDFQPAHVASARALAEDGELDNLTLLECSFADLAAGKVDLPPLDFITMYGVYSWVTPENRRHVVDFIGRYLKPGGIVYVNYNAMPGWAGVLPLQRLMLEHAERHPAGRERQVAQARDFVEAMKAAGCRYVDDNPVLRHRLASLADDKAGYLAHEYLNRGWEPLYHADVVRDMANAKLDFAGAANPAHAYPALFLDERQRSLLAPIDDAVMRETVKDYLHNTAFREDVMVRGARRMSAARQAEWLARIGLARTSVDADSDVEPLPPGIDATEAQRLLPPLRRMLQQLAAGPLPLATLAAALELPLAQAARLAALLASSGHAALFLLDGALSDARPARALNRAIARAALHGDQYQVLASPLLGGGLRAGLVQRLIYTVLTDRPDLDDGEAILAAVRHKLERYREAAGCDSRQGAQLASLTATLPQTVAAILRLRVPVWRALQVL
ncbi:class I SAM-dependent methyltransferase [Pseudoduganella chitinolytica]|uniref:Class I SAM-dependent methyltransferase n=1 Tax=Pseudoduganella chitinolytica TaxID=34070 RepID=A0ABY8BCY5_9BURK|nr:class I SAM-dependent methyltransferase [Pseudoduganella chitinolytica]WEF32214.1 class I SAM-dependent methyltransferase [Pseudoduganella chitinolytica]